MPNNLPLNWCECKFEDVLDYEQPTRYIVSNTDYQEQGIAVLTAGKSFILGYTDEKDGIFDASKETVIIFDDFTTASKLVDFPFKVKSSAMKILHAKKDININFLYYLMQTIHYESDTHKRYWISEYAKQTLNLPPLAEQERIVEKIEELFSDIDNGIKDLKTAQAQIKQYRQSVLKSAFEGKLYKTSEWKEVKLEDVCQINPKTEIKDMKDDDIVSFLPMTSVKAECNYYTEENVLYSKVKKGYTKFKNGDVLFAKITPCMENGKVCIVDNLIQDIGFGSTEFHILRCLNNIIPKYVYYVVIQQCFRKKAKKNMVGAVGQQRVPADFMKNFDILLPSLLEQQQIVAEIEKRFLVADELEKAVNDGLEKADKLKQSILKKAFEGKLVPQDPNDEPASALLDRIKKEQKPTKGKKK